MENRARLVDIKQEKRDCIKRYLERETKLNETHILWWAKRVEKSLSHTLPYHRL